MIGNSPLFNYHGKIVRNFLSTEDFCRFILGIGEEDSLTPYDSAFDSFDLKSLCQSKFGFSANALSWIGEDSHINELLRQYVFPREWGNFVGFVDGIKPTDGEIFNRYNSFMLKLLSKLKETAPTYELLLDVYGENGEALLGGIANETESVSRINDTPQEREVGDHYETDNYVSNVASSKSKTTSDGGTPMARRKEIRNDYENLMISWAMEIEKIFFRGQRR